MSSCHKKESKEIKYLSIEDLELEELHKIIKVSCIVDALWKGISSQKNLIGTNRILV